MSAGSGPSLSVNLPTSLRGGLLLLLVGVAVAGYGGYDYVQQADAVENAVEVDATILETGVDRTSGGRRGGVDYRPTVSFEYSFEGERYTSTDVFPASVTSNYDTRSAAESVLDGYAAGDTVTAYTDPGSPGDGFLKNERTNGPLWAMAFGAVFALAGLVSAGRALLRG